MTLFSPWSYDVWIVCAIPVDENISVIPTPIALSELILSIVSFVILFLGSFVSTRPISLEAAKHWADSGSETALSLLVCGKSSLTGWENFSPVNGATVGVFDELRTFT